MEQHFPILVAEDNPVSRKLLEKTLIKTEHEVVCVKNGREALEAFNERFFPIVLTDWMMPQMDGLELCQAIRENRSSRYVFIILLTAKDSQTDIITGLEAGADDYLTKPFDKAELIARLNTGKRILRLERSLKKANDEIKILSITDPLTGSYNRRYLSESFPKEINRARRYSHPLSVILCDIDHFKRVNDTYGHETGDQVLKAFANCITESIRQDVDWLARYGGEEFVEVLPETDTEGALTVAERLRGLVSQSVTEAHGNAVRITASFGVTGFDPAIRDEGISSTAMLNEADKRLYECKQEGRNRVKGHPL